MTHGADDSQRRLLALLGPLHDQALKTARRLSRSQADGDDLFQEAVLRALDRLPSLRDEARFRSWFFAILLSLHRNRHRRNVWRRWLPLQEVAEPAAPLASSGQTSRRLARALATLSAAEREALILFELQGFQLEEIAQLQASSVNALKSRLSRARERLRRHYERTGIGLSGLLEEKTP
jgi:RNA polymerase sigma-70 factor (ECF subfamily)